MKRIALFLLFSVVLIGKAAAGPGVMNWKLWDAYPNVQRMSADSVQQLLLSGEKMILIYAGYKTDEIICGSIYLPYTKVPPSADGSQVNLNISKDTWMVSYCP